MMIYVRINLLLYEIIYTKGKERMLKLFHKIWKEIFLKKNKQEAIFTDMTNIVYVL